MTKVYMTAQQAKEVSDKALLELFKANLNDAIMKAHDLIATHANVGKKEAWFVLDPDAQLSIEQWFEFINVFTDLGFDFGDKHDKNNGPQTIHLTWLDRTI